MENIDRALEGIYQAVERAGFQVVRQDSMDEFKVWFKDVHAWVKTLSPEDHQRFLAGEPTESSFAEWRKQKGE